MSEPITLLRVRDVCTHVALSRSTIYEEMAAGTFPLGWLDADFLEGSRLLQCCYATSTARV